MLGENVRFEGAVITNKPKKFINEMERVCEKFGKEKYHFTFK